MPNWFLVILLPLLILFIAVVVVGFILYRMKHDDLAETLNPCKWCECCPGMHHHLIRAVRVFFPFAHTAVQVTGICKAAASRSRRSCILSDVLRKAKTVCAMLSLVQGIGKSIRSIIAASRLQCMVIYPQDVNADLMGGEVLTRQVGHKSHIIAPGKEK